MVFEAWEAEDGSDLCCEFVCSLVFLGSRRWMEVICALWVCLLSCFLCKTFSVHLKEETDWLDGFEAWEAEDGSDMNCCVSLFALLFVVVEDAFLFASPQKKNGVPKRECSIVSWTLIYANVVLWAGLLFFKFVCVFGRLCMYLEDPLLPVHLNEEPDLVDGFEAWESKDALHCEFVCSLCLFLWKKPFVPHSPSLA